MRVIYYALLFIVMPLSAHAILLGTANMAMSGSSSPPFTHEVRYGLTYSGFPPAPGLFNDVLLTPASVGQVLTATALTDPDFAGIAATLSNNVSNLLAFYALFGNNLGASIGNAEKSWFNLLSDDFSGFAIDTITMTIDEVVFEDVGSVTNFTYAVTVRVYGDDPLPVAATTWGSIKAMYR